MESKKISKIVFDGEVLMDLTADTVTPDALAQGITAHDKRGVIITGTSTKDSDTSDATLSVAEALEGGIFYARGKRFVGTMPNNGGISRTIAARDQEVSIPFGGHDGSGKVSIDAAEKEKLIPANIKQGITVLGIEGQYSGESASLQSKTVIPKSADQTVLPDEGYDYLSSVVVKAIPYTETENAAGGTTVTIGG